MIKKKDNQNLVIFFYALIICLSQSNNEPILARFITTYASASRQSTLQASFTIEILSALAFAEVFLLVLTDSSFLKLKSK